MTLLDIPSKISLDNIIPTFLKEVDKTAVYAFDIEHDPATPFYDPNFDLWGISIAVGTYVWYLEGDLGKEIINKAFALTETTDGREIEAVAHNGKYDLKCLRAAKWIKDGTKYPKYFRDTMIAANILNEKMPPKQLGLDVLVDKWYNYQMMTFDEASSDGKQSEKFHKYATDDSRYTLRLYLDLKPRIDEAKLWKYYTRIVCPVCFAFSDLELHGNKWDLRQAASLLSEFSKAIGELQEEIFSEIGVLNLNSGDQLAKRLFDERGLSTKNVPLTKGGKRYAVDEKTLNALAKEYEICAKIVDYRSAHKMINTYLEPLSRFAMNEKNCRIHPTIWVVSATGRTREQNPNLQNIPVFLSERYKHLYIRSCFIPEKGRKLIVADYSQIELRIAAHITKDRLFLEAFRSYQCNVCGEKGDSGKLLRACPKCGALENERILFPLKNPDARGFWHGLDLHQNTANSVSVLKGDRSKGKISNFALIYKATSWKMNQIYPELSQEEWEVAIQQFMERYHGVYEWHIKMEALMNAGGTCYDLFGRRRRIERWEIDKAYKHCLNMIINHPVQASATSLAELATINLRKHWIDKGYWENKILFPNYVHDELVFEADEDVIEDAKIDIANKMENSVEFIVPIRVDIKVVDRWSEAKAA